MQLRQRLQPVLLWFVCCPLLVGCSFVQVSDAGANIAVVSSAEAASCIDKGAIVSQTKAKVLVNRGATKVRQELIDLARNQAATMGANVIVPIGEPDQGKQHFRAYLCESS